MTRYWCRLAIAFAIVSISMSPAYAEEWVPASPSTAALYETDIGSLIVKDKIVSSWTRETSIKPRTDESTKQTYTQTLTRRFDDCRTRQFRLGAQVRRNREGQDIGTLTSEGNWQDVVPGSINEGLWRTNCAIVNRPKGRPLLDSLFEGDWRDLGLSEDNLYKLAINVSAIVKLPNGLVLAFSRSDYAKPEWIDGFAVRYVVVGTVIDCNKSTAADAAVDYYVSPSLRVNSTRVDLKDIVLDPIPNKTFLRRNLKKICATAVENTDQASDDDQESVTGTAWGVSKGYLITASHVVEGSHQIFVYSNGEKVAEARVVANDPANDLALLKLTKPMVAKLKILPLAEHGAALGKNVFTLGYPEPGVLGQNIKMTAGQVSSTSGPHDDARFLQISIPIQPGNSGGPVLGWDGAVVGVVNSKLLKFEDDNDEPPPDGVNYAVKSAYIRPMLDDLPDLDNYEVVKPVAEQEQLVDAARQAVFMLLVTK